MFILTFKINGRTVRPDQIGNALENAILQEVESRIRKKVGAVRCSIHDSSPTKIEAAGSSLDRLSFKIYGCCNDLIDDVKHALS